MAYYSDSELARNRKAQDKLMAERHRQFDLQAQENTPKHHRLHFAVVGEGTRTAQERYRTNYSLIDWEA